MISSPPPPPQPPPVGCALFLLLRFGLAKSHLQIPCLTACLLARVTLPPPSPTSDDAAAGYDISIFSPRRNPEIDNELCNRKSFARTVYSGDCKCGEVSVKRYDSFAEIRDISPPRLIFRRISCSPPSPSPAVAVPSFVPRRLVPAAVRLGAVVVGGALPRAVSRRVPRPPAAAAVRQSRPPAAAESESHRDNRLLHSSIYYLQ